MERQHCGLNTGIFVMDEAFPSNLTGKGQGLMEIGAKEKEKEDTAMWLQRTEWSMGTYKRFPGGLLCRGSAFIWGQAE